MMKNIFALVTLFFFFTIGFGQQKQMMIMKMVNGKPQLIRENIQQPIPLLPKQKASKPSQSIPYPLRTQKINGGTNTDNTDPNPLLVKDINPSTYDPGSNSDPRLGYRNYPDTGVAISDGTFFFPAHNFNGIELWQTDGTDDGTVITKDIASSSANSDANPMFLQAVGNDLYFFTRELSYVRGTYDYFYRLRKRDGNTGYVEEGSLTDSPFDDVFNVIQANGYLFFFGVNKDAYSNYFTNNDTALIKFDPSNNQYEVISNFKPREMYAFQNLLVFSADNGINGREPWAYDIDNDDVHLFFDVNTTGDVSASSNPHDFIDFNGILYYTATDGISGMQLKTFDPSTNSFSGADLPGPYFDPHNKIVFNDNLYFRTTNGTNNTYDVYKYDGNGSFEKIATDKTATNGALTIANNRLFFAANDGTNKNQLWQTDGNNVATRVGNKNINDNGDANPTNFTVANNKLLFIAANASNNGSQDIWATDGDNASIIEAAVNNKGNVPKIIGVQDVTAYFFFDDGQHGQELWKTDGTAAGTTMVSDINKGDNYSIGSAINGMEVFKNALYFGAYDGTNPSIYKSDGTAAGTTAMITAGSGAFDYLYGSATQLKAVGNTLFFAAGDYTKGYELWKTDGTQAGTMPVKDINTNNSDPSNAGQTDDSSPSNFTTINGKLYFTANDGVNGNQLWVSDGTAAGTLMVAMINGINDPGIDNMIADTVANKIYFTANDGTHGKEPWVSDGTAAGTFMLKDINPGSDGSGAGYFAVYKGKAFFNATNPTYGNEPWVSDGTTLGTTILQDINPGSGSSNNSGFAPLGSFLYFAADPGGNSNTGLWRTDGTSAGTHPFNTDATFAFNMANTGNKITFIANSPSAHGGFAIWSTDGTKEGTIDVSDFGDHGIGGFVIGIYTTFKNHYFTWTSDNVHGNELWETDGTVNGSLVNDIAPGELSSYPNALKGNLNTALFAANDGTAVGYELYGKTVYESVVWRNFTATKQIDSTVLLKWSTSSEINNLGYNIQRSSDNLNYAIIGRVNPASPVSATGAAYSFIDPAPNNGINYYRLQQLDNLGNPGANIIIPSYSNVETVSFYKPLKGGIVKGNDTLCIGQSPTDIVDSIPVSGGASGECRQSGVFGVGPQYCNFQWQDSLVNGSWQNIPYATYASYGSSALNITTYFRRKVYDVNHDSAYSNIVAKVYKTIPGDTSFAPTNAWNAYLFIPSIGAADVSLTDSTAIYHGVVSYLGYYQSTASSSPDYNTLTDWDASAGPTTAAIYQGCPLLAANSPFTIVLKRKGFTPGNYILNLIRYSSSVRVFVNHVQFADLPVNYLGGSSTIVSIGALDANSIVEIRMANQPYYNANQLNFSFYNADLQPGTIAGNQTICALQTASQLTSIQNAYGGPAPLSIAYQWQSSLKTPTAWQNISGATASSYQPTILTDTTFFRRAVGDGQSGIFYSDTITINVIAVRDIPTITRVGRVLYANSVPGISYFKWFRNNVEISGATNSTYIAALAGTYTAKYVENCGDGPASTAIVLANDAQSQTINFPQPTSIVYGTSTFIKLLGTVNSGLGLQYSVASGPASISNDTIYINGAGTISITASQPGNDNYTPATSITQTFSVSKGNQSITFTSIANKKYGDAPFAVSASSSVGLGINYSIVSGPAYVSGNTVTLTGAGSIVVKASQGGNGNYNAAAEVQTSFCVGINQISAVKGDTLVCPNTYKYAVDSITGGLFKWGVSGGGTVSVKGDTAIVTWQTPGDYILFAKAYSSCDTARSITSTLVIHVATVVVPTPVTNMFPADGTQNLQLPLSLSWIPGANSNSYDLYVWDANTTKPATPYASNITGVNYTLPNVGFAYNTTYKWSITSHNPCSQVDGAVQTFGLIPLPDLMVSNVQVPATAFSGQNVAITWKVTNNGPGITNLNQRWNDAIFLSFDTNPIFTVPPQTNPAAWSQVDFPIKPLLLGAVSNVSALNAGESYTNSFNFTLPLYYNFPVYVYVITNYAPGSTAPQEVTLLNDTARAVSPIAVTLSPAPDLRVDSVLTPTEVFSGSTVNVTYKVKNYGALTPTGNNWTDKVYISQNPFFDVATAIPLNAPKGNGTYYYNATLAEFAYKSQLQQDDSYNKSVSVVIPNFIQGSYYIYVVTDAKNTVYEGSLENNNAGRNLVTVYLTPTPNLTVSSLSAPTTISITQPLGISWNIKNIGYYDNFQRNQGHYLGITNHCSTCYIGPCGPATDNQGRILYIYCPLPAPGYSVRDSAGFGSSYWNDNVYLSTDPSQLNVNKALFIGAYAHGTTPAGNFDYSTSVPPTDRYGGNIGIPENANPRLYDVNVATSINQNSVFGGSLPPTATLPDNLPQGTYYLYVLANADKSVYEYPDQQQIRRSDAIVVTRPDISVTSVSAPASSVSGQSINVSYQITNGGPGSVFNHSRTDYVYISTSTVFDGNAQLIATPTYTENLPINAPVSHQLTYHIPIDASGMRYFFVRVNVDSSFRENNYTNNINTTPGSTNVALTPPPNLLVSNITTPASVSTVIGFPFSYTVPNNGTGTTAGTWTDSIFVSCSPTFNPSTAYGIAVRSHNNAIAPGSTYTDSFSLVVPYTSDISTCFGSNNPTLGYFYVKTNANRGLYEGSDTTDNVLGTGIKTITNPFVDQIVTSVVGMDAATVGRNYATTWTVKNIGANPGYPNYYGWNDALFFSTDSVFNGNAISGGNYYENTLLNTNQTYTSTNANFITPNIATGDYYVFINTNNYNNIRGEINLGNNNNLIRDIDGKAKKIHVTLPPLPDLTDTILLAPTTVATGQPLGVTYQVSNNGSGITYPSTWSDGFWLSSDFIPGNAGDIFLGSFNHSGALQVGQSYTDTVSLPIAMTVIPGNYVLIAKTNSSGALFETNTNNNLAFRYVTVFTPPPTDLIVTNIIRPDTVYLGYADSTTWSLSNISSNPANGIETDGIYLSKTATLDSSAVLLGTSKNTLALQPLALDTIKLAPIVQGVTEGQYYLIVKTDILNNIVETNKDNNTGISATPIYVKVKPLPLNVTTSGILANLPLYYKLTIPDILNGATILLTLKSNDSLTANNQLYVGKGYVPTAAHFDYAFDKPNYGNQQILMPSVTNADYYITTNCTTANPPTQNITLLAVNLPFAIVSLDAKQGGNSGNVTIKITGSLFATGMQAVLHGSSANIAASTVYYTNSTTAYATFNLQGAPLGLYDLTLTKTDLSTTTLAQGFTIVNPNNGGLITGGGVNTGATNNGNTPGCDPGAPSGLNAQLQTQVVIPPKVFGGRVFTITINYSNPTNVDISAQTRILYSLNNIPISLTQDGLADGKTSLYIQFTEQNGPPGIIRAGGTGTITIYSKTPTNYPGHTDIHYNLK